MRSAPVRVRSRRQVTDANKTEAVRLVLHGAGRFQMPRVLTMSRKATCEIGCVTPVNPSQCARCWRVFGRPRDASVPSTRGSGGGLCQFPPTAHAIGVRHDAGSWRHMRCAAHGLTDSGITSILSAHVRDGTLSQRALITSGPTTEIGGSSGTSRTGKHSAIRVTGGKRVRTTGAALRKARCSRVVTFISDTVSNNS